MNICYNNISFDGRRGFEGTTSRSPSIFDTHNDFLTGGLTAHEIEAYLLAARDAGLKGVIAALWTSEMTADEVLSQRNVRYSLDGLEILYAIEDAGFLRESGIEALEEIKPFSVGLTWNGENALAGGALSGGGVKDFGRDVVRVIREAGVVLDTAHIARQAFFDCVQIWDKPIFCSHACCRDVFWRQDLFERNFDREQLKVISESHGFFGVTFVPKFLCGQNACGAEEVFVHIDYAVQNFGIDFVGLGSDFFGSKFYPNGLSDYSGYKSLTKILKSHGYSDRDIDKIFYQNFIDFLQRNNRPHML